MKESNADLNNTFDEVPELGDDFFQRADLMDGSKVVRRGRPKAESPKQRVTIRFDADIVEYFKSTGKGWQSRMNEALSNWIKEHTQPEH